MISKKELKRLKNLVSNTRMENLKPLRESVCVSNYSPIVKEAIIYDIDMRLYPKNDIGSCFIVQGELAMGEV